MEKTPPWDSLLKAVARIDAIDPATVGPKVGAVLAGRHRIDAVLGAGGVGTVYAATDLATGAEIALKWLHPRSIDDGGMPLRRLRVEAEAALRITHPNVLRTFGIEEHDDTLYLTMERLHGEPLSALLTREGSIAPRAAIALVLPAVRGVAAAHDAGVLHRDLKPHNIFLSLKDGALVPKVLDFGMAKLLIKLRAESSLTAEGAALGTPELMSPEQARDAKSVDERADVYSLGVVLYYAASGCLPYEGKGWALLKAVIGGKARPLAHAAPGIDPAFAALVGQAMAHDRNARFSSCHALAAALEALLHEMR